MSPLKVGLVSAASLSITATAFIAAAATLFAASSMDPLTVDPPHYTLEIENQWTRVFREHMGPRDTMIMHQHPLPGAVIVMLTDRHNRLTAPDKTFKEFQNKAGYVMWSNASTHQSENLDAINFEALQIEPRHPAGAVTTPAPAEKLDPVVTDPKHFHVEVENEYVRVIREKIGPHEKLAMLKHPDTKSVIVYLTDYHVSVDNGPEKVGGPVFSAETLHRAKTVRFSNALPAHSEENLGDAPAELIRVELKQAR